MARCPFAEWKPLRENDTQSTLDPTQVIYHSLTSTSALSSWGWMQNAAVKEESHFLIEYDGHIIQAVDTAVRADAQWAANIRAVSIETASNHGATDPWTPQQADALVRLSTWLLNAHPRIGERICRTWDDPGFGYHRQFDQWNQNKHSCPGPLRVKQFPMIVNRILTPAPTPPPVEDDDMAKPAIVRDDNRYYVVPDDIRYKTPIASEADLAWFQKTLGYPLWNLSREQVAAIPLNSAPPAVR